MPRVAKNREFETPQSSNIKRVAWDKSKLKLTVEFKSGGIYEYMGVPQKIYDGFKKAPSAGKYFWANIRNVYPYRRVYSFGTLNKYLSSEKTN